MAEMVHVKKFGNYYLGEIVKTKTFQDRKFYTLKVKKIYSGEDYYIDQTLSISEHELKYYKTEVK